MKCILQLCIPDIVPLSFCDVPKTSYEDWFQNVEKSFVCHKAKKFIEEYEQGNASLPDTDNSSTSFAITPPIKQENCIKHEVRKDYENIPDSRPSHKHKDTLSSEHDFISSPILFAYIWFLADTYWMHFERFQNNIQDIVGGQTDSQHDAPQSGLF